MVQTDFLALLESKAIEFEDLKTKVLSECGNVLQRTSIFKQNFKKSQEVWCPSMQNVIHSKLVEVLIIMALYRDKNLQALGVKMDQMRSELLQTSQNLILENFSKLPNAQPTMTRTLLQDFEQHTKTFVDQQISNLSQMVQTLDAKMNGIDSQFVRTSEIEKAIQMIFRKCDSVSKANPINPPLSSDPIFIAMQSEVARVGLELN